MIKSFFQSTYWLWVIAKMLIILLLFVSSISLLMEGNLRSDELAINWLAVIEGILLTISLAHDFGSTRLGWLKIITGTILFVGGVALMVTLFGLEEGERSEAYAIGFPLTLLMIFTGLFDVLRLEKKKT